MKNAVNDIWQDLREKRLWPVALLLLIALIAVPVVLAESGGETEAPAPIATPKPTPKEDEELAKLATVELEESAPGEGSTLDTFDPSNPFRPPEKVMDEAEKLQEGADGPTEEVTVEESGGETSVTVDESGGGSAPPMPETPPADQPEETVTTQYKYVIDVTFTANGEKRKIKGMERLDMLPSKAVPLLLFLGATPDGGNGVFLVDSTLDTAGEGRCEPSKDDCSMVHLGAGSEQEFTNEEGDSYTVLINEIRKVKIDPNAKAGKARAGAARGTTRRFTPALISDMVSETTTTTPASPAEGDGGK